MALSTRPRRRAAEDEPEMTPEAVQAFLQAARLNEVASVRVDFSSFGSRGKPGSRQRRANAARRRARQG